jgi:ADP-ribose pyrophosphatase
MDDAHLIETTIERRVLHRGRFITFRLDTIEDAAGRRHPREVVEHPGAVCILPILGDDVLMVRQFRTPIGQVLLELPAGTLDRQPDGSIEDPAVAAPRELAEETGYRAADWRSLGSFWSAPGFTEELMHLYLARELSAIDGYAGPDVDEHLEVRRLPWRAAVAMAAAGEIRDAKSLVGLLHLGLLAEAGGLDPSSGIGPLDHIDPSSGIGHPGGRPDEGPPG